MDKEKEHQLHITIPKSLHDEIKEIMPDYGSVSSLVRNLLKRFIFNYHKVNKGMTEESPFDVTASGMAKETIIKKGGSNGTR